RFGKVEPQEAPHQTRRRAIYAEDWSSGQSARRGATREPGDSRGPSLQRHGHELRQSSLGSGVPGEELPEIGEEGLSGPAGHRQRNRAPQTRRHGDEDRYADEGAGKISGKLGDGDIAAGPRLAVAPRLPE